MATIGRSGIWQHFTKVKEGEDTFLICNLCQAKYKRVDGSTTGARQHLKLKHSELHEHLKAKDEKKQTTKRSWPSVGVSSTSKATAVKIKRPTWNVSAQKEERLTELILEMILTQNLPFSFVEEPTFRALMHEVAPGYTVPGRKALSTTHLETAMQKQVRRIREKIDQCNPQGFAFTSDIWMSRTGDSYVDLHTFFIDENFTSIHCELLDVVEFPESHTARNILEKWDRPLDTYGIELERYETFMTSDSDSNMVAARETAQFHGITCIGHDLHLAVQKTMHAVPEVHAAFETGSNIVDYIKDNEEASEKLKKICETLHMVPLNVIKRIPTRWNSYLQQEARLQELKRAIILMSAEDGDLPTRNEAEWTIAQQCVEILRPIEQLTKSMSGQFYPTLSARAPTIHKAKKEIREVLDSMLLHDKVSEFGVALQSNLDFYCYGSPNESTEKWSQAATAIDPRFKFILFDKEVIERVRRTLLEFYHKIQGRLQSKNNVVEEGASKESVVTGWEFLEERKVETNCSSKELPVDFDSELQQFWKADWTKIHECPLKWWKVNKTRFPNVAKLAQILLAVPATSTTSERLWSA